MYPAAPLGSSFLAAFLFALPASGASIQTYAFTVAGQSACATFGPTTQVSTTIGSGSIEVSTPGPGCGVTENLMDLTSAAGLITANSAAAGGGNTTFGAFTYSGSSTSQGDFMNLRVAAFGTLSGATDAFSTRGSEAFAKMTDGLTRPASSEPDGFVRVNYTVHGTQTVSGRGETTMELLFAKNTGPGFLAFRAQNAAGTGTTVNVNGTYVTALPGMVITADSITMNTPLSFLVPANVNEHFDLTMVLYGSALPASTGLSSPSTVTDDFFGTLTITGIDVLDSQGNLVNGAQVLRDSAAADAVVSSEPGSMLLAGAALAALSLFRKARAGAMS